ncbi:MAG: hypothetical protein JW751_19695 [Polyangiaceae bacterium]|nr:hypothetical protein [Polyangiaceae bacterium]
MRLAIALVTLVGVGMGPAVAAAEGDCPPGGWFCEGADASDAPAGEEPDEESSAGELGTNAETLPSPSVVVVTPAGAPPPKVVVVGEDTEPPPPPEPVPRTRPEWGINLRLQSAILGDDAGKADDAGMGGTGLSIRFRPVPHFALDGGLDVVGGTDWQGNSRTEVGATLNGIVFFNPTNLVQFYMIGGLGLSAAEVDVAPCREIDGEISCEGTSGSRNRHYEYFGGNLGAGLEFRVSRRVALNFDLIGFLRGRTDRLAESEPEFVDPDDPTMTTNTSGGGLLRGGITFYW